MLSDDSSSESETGRFKSRPKISDEQSKSFNRKEDSFRSTIRSRPPENDRFRREFDKKRDDRNVYDRHSRESHRYPRYSPMRRRHSRERSANRRSRDREKYSSSSRGRSRQDDHRGESREKLGHSRPQTRKSPEHRRIVKDDGRRSSREEMIRKFSPKEKSIEKHAKKPKELSSSPEYKSKKSVILKPDPVVTRPRKSSSPIVIAEQDESNTSVEVQCGSYYNIIPSTVVEDKSEESSEIDSSDDEGLRAKLLNLEKELHKTRKKNSKKKHKKKSSQSSKDRERQPETSTAEVSSTTDIDKTNVVCTPVETTENMLSKADVKDNIEEGEITSDDESQVQIEIDPTDLRHKLKRSVPTADTSSEIVTSKLEKVGPAANIGRTVILKRSRSRDIEGPALPPHLQRMSKKIGPSIPEDMRKVLAETDREIVKYVSSDEDVGYGPLPPGAEDKWSDAHRRLEERALNIKIKNLEGHSMSKTVKSREEWMLQLPEGKAKYLGLEARSFRAREGPDMSDRSSWTDTPEEKARKAAGLAPKEDPEAVLQREARARHIDSRDEEQEKAVKKHKKKHKREESLLDMHQKKLKKKKKKEDKDESKKERRPFSRDVDLQVNKFDEAQKKSIIKKAQDLNTRFSRGEAKFL